MGSVYPSVIRCYFPLFSVTDFLWVLGNVPENAKGNPVLVLSDEGIEGIAIMTGRNPIPHPLAFLPWQEKGM
jgi:hypothetical protein